MDNSIQSNTLDVDESQQACTFSRPSSLNTTVRNLDNSIQSNTLDVDESQQVCTFSRPSSLNTTVRNLDNSIQSNTLDVDESQQACTFSRPSSLNNTVGNLDYSIQSNTLDVDESQQSCTFSRPPSLNTTVGNLENSIQSNILVDFDELPQNDPSTESFVNGECTSSNQHSKQNSKPLIKSEFKKKIDQVLQNYSIDGEEREKYIAEAMQKGILEIPVSNYIN